MATAPASHGAPAAGAATGSTTATPPPPPSSSGSASGTGPGGTGSNWDQLGLIALIGIALSIPAVRQIAFGIIAAPILALTSILISLFGPTGWLVQLFNWAFISTPGVRRAAVLRGAAAISATTLRYMRIIGWTLMGILILLALGIYFQETRFVALVFTILGAMSFLFFRAVNLIPGHWLNRIPARMRNALGTLTMGLFFLAILALAAHDVLPTLTFGTWLMLVLLALILSASGTMLGTHGEFGRWAMKWASIGLVLAVVLPQLFNFSSNPVLVAGRHAVVAIRDSSASGLLNFARRTEPKTPIALDEINRRVEQTVTGNEISRYQNRADALVAISATRSLTDSEIAELRQATVRIKELKDQLQNLGSENDSNQTYLRTSRNAEVIRLVSIAGVAIALIWIVGWLLFSGTHSQTVSTGGAHESH